MSYRELKNFLETLRCLGYPRIVSIENFRKPNFELVAEISYWLVKRYDSDYDISDDIDTEDARVEFIKRVCELFVTRERLNLNPKKIYQADGYAVQELLKVAHRLYKAQKICDGNDNATIDRNLKMKLQGVKQMKAHAQEITDSGAKLYSLLGQEEDLKKAREGALTFLENLSKQGEGENNWIKNSVESLVQNQRSQIINTEKMVENLKGDEARLSEKLSKKQGELAIIEKRVKSLQSVRPPFMDELERLQSELEYLYRDYVTKYRNLNYLESELERYHKVEESRAKESRRQMQKMRDQIKDEELKHMMDGEDYEEGDSDQKINQKFVKGSYAHRNDNVSDSADVSMDEGAEDQAQELDDDEDSQDLDENLMDDEDAKDF